MAGTPHAKRPKYVTIDCRKCLQATKHQILKDYETKGTLQPPYPEITFYDAYRILQCRGCEGISFQHASWNTDDWGEDGFVVTQEVYPYRLSGRKMIDGQQYLPESVKRVYQETHTTLAANAFILGAIGIRAVVEAVCNDKKTKGNLDKKIDELANSGWLSQQQTKFLHKSRLLGNLAAHEMATPSPSTLGGVLTIVENLLETVYVLPAM